VSACYGLHSVSIDSRDYTLKISLFQGIMSIHRTDAASPFPSEEQSQYRRYFPAASGKTSQ